MRIEKKKTGIHEGFQKYAIILRRDRETGISISISISIGIGIGIGIGGKNIRATHLTQVDSPKANHAKLKTNYASPDHRGVGA